LVTGDGREDALVRPGYYHPSTHLVTGDGREDALVIPGYYHPSTHLVAGDGREDALVIPGYYHPSTHLVTGDGREDVLARPGYQLSATIFSTLTVVCAWLIIKRKIVLYMAEDRGNSCAQVVMMTTFRSGR